MWTIKPLQHHLVLEDLGVRNNVEITGNSSDKSQLARIACLSRKQCRPTAGASIFTNITVPYSWYSCSITELEYTPGSAPHPLTVRYCDYERAKCDAKSACVHYYWMRPNLNVLQLIITSISRVQNHEHQLYFSLQSLTWTCIVPKIRAFIPT